MIISASRRTDIPAFYGEWFMNRIREGYFFKVNPYNPSQKTGVSLAPEKVDAIVFWTKYPESLLEYLDELDQRGYNYYFQFTLNDYPDWLEPNLPPLEKRIELFRQLSSRLGSRRVIWRYDPVIVSDQTPVGYHQQTFARLAEQLKESTFRVVVSWLDFYGKTERKLKDITRERGIRFYDLVEREEQLGKLARQLRAIAEENSLEIRTCGEQDNLSAEIIEPGKCIDDKLITEVFGTELEAKEDPHQRANCCCAQAEDMGVYNTCQFACRYCYANESQEEVQAEIKDHDPESPVLIGQCEEKFVEQTSLFT